MGIENLRQKIAKTVISRAADVTDGLSLIYLNEIVNLVLMVYR